MVRLTNIKLLLTITVNRCAVVVIVLDAGSMPMTVEFATSEEWQATKMSKRLTTQKDCQHSCHITFSESRASTEQNVTALHIGRCRSPR